MTPPSPIARFFAALDGLLERALPTWWGAVVTDARFPSIHDLNYARVDSGQPDLTLADVEDALLPAVTASGASFFHVVAFEPDGCARLLEDLRDAGHTLSWDTLMRYGGSVEEDHGPTVQPIVPGPALWTHLDRAFREFSLSDPEVRRQLLQWNRQVLAPAGRRWFGVQADGGIAGIGSVHVLDEVAYLDDVVTMPAFRRRGVASAVVRRLVAEARGRGASDVLLLADQPGPVRLYRSLGFEEVGRVASVVSGLGRTTQASGSSGSAAGSPPPGTGPPRRASDQGAGPG
jgi:ribosomal protein S18 acetylase RimI-like enzyme